MEWLTNCVEWLASNWTMLIVVIAVIAAIGVSIFAFIKSGKASQVTKIKEWLLYACTIAEKELGEGTGQLKLRYVYDMFVDKFGFIKVIITFEEFSEMVDEALDNMRAILESNAVINALVTGVVAEEEVVVEEVQDENVEPVEVVEEEVQDENVEPVEVVEEEKTEG